MSGVPARVVSLSTTTSGVLDVVLRDEIDFTNAAGVTDAILSALAQWRPGSVRIDLDAVTFLDSSGIGVLVAAMRAAEGAGAAFRVSGAAPRILDQLSMVGLLEAFGLDEPVAG